MTKMLKTVHGKLSLVLLALLFLLGALTAGLTLYTTPMYLREVNQRLNRDLASELAQHLIAKNLLRDDPRVQKARRAEIKQNMVLNPHIEIYILDPQGRILDYYAVPGVVRLRGVSLDPVQRFIGRGGHLPIFGDDPRHPGQQKIFSAARIPSATGSRARDHLQGYIYIILSGQQYDATAGTLNHSYILRWSLSALAGVLGLAALAGALSFGFLTRRLRRLTRNMEEFGTRHLDGGALAVSEKSNSDEIDRLERIFGQMSERIAAQLTTLQQADVYRREAVSNVSHDLRTPLAALQGYLETMQMKEGQLSPAEQREYLATATRHAQRLGRLVSELFDQARLESGVMELRLEEFSLAELVQDVTQQFELAAQKKGVQLEIDLGQERPVVHADIGLIERAMENLIDNALRHTPAGGRVMVALRAGEARAMVRVTDTGSGIAPEELPHIFDRYYRAPREAEPEASDGVGLGLDITRRIVELHGGGIEAHSIRGEGATFTFSLPVASGSRA
ncbi:MAG: HAMP domain-containing histidine kinase [Armatimonadetes bacterium]|nr:HAMP domain-containing histidine kinase [Armatimonadota bacterium]